MSNKELNQSQIIALRPSYVESQFITLKTINYILCNGVDLLNFRRRVW